MATNNAINTANPIAVASGGTGASTMATTDGVCYYDGTKIVVTAAGTAAQILTSNGAGVAPTYQTSVSGVSTFHTGGSDATVAAGAITIAGGSNISTTGASSTVTIALATSPSVSGSLTAGTSITATSGDLTITSGNILLPTTSSSVGQIQWNAVSYIHTYGTRNFFAGQTAGNFTLTTGSAVDNVGMGYNALAAITTAAGCSAMGSGALAACTTSSFNWAGGYNALNVLTTGSGENTALGSLALVALATGANNLAVGYNAGSAYTTSESSNILIGHIGTAAESNVMRIGTNGSGAGQQSSCFIAGIQGVTVSNSAAVLMDTTTGQMGTVVSSIRYKENVIDMGSNSDALMKLRPVCFTYKEHPDFGKQYGLIAEEVHEILPEIVVYNENKEPDSVQYHALPVMLLNELQKQYKMVMDLTEQIKILEEKV